MLMFPMPARYLAEINATVRELAMRIRMDEQCHGGIVDGERVDPARIGTIVLIVADMATADAGMTVNDVARSAREESPALVAPGCFSLGLTV